MFSSKWKGTFCTSTLALHAGKASSLITSTLLQTCIAEEQRGLTKKGSLIITSTLIRTGIAKKERDVSEEERGVSDQVC